MPWPSVKIEMVDPNWWQEVMNVTANIKFCSELDDSADFTIRSIVHVILTKKREVIEWFFENSSLKERVLMIYDLLKSGDNDKKKQGQSELSKLINDFVKDTMTNKPPG